MKRPKRLRFGRFLRRILAAESGIIPYKIRAYLRGAFIVNPPCGICVLRASRLNLEYCMSGIFVNQMSVIIRRRMSVIATIQHPHCSEHFVFFAVGVLNQCH